MPDLYLTESARLRVCQYLRAAPEYTAHEHAIREDLRGNGMALSADAVRGLLAWLDEQGAVVLLGDAVRVARLTQRGEDAATGAARIPGIARPRPV